MHTKVYILLIIYIQLTDLVFSYKWTQDFTKFPKSWPLKNVDDGNFREIIDDPIAQPGANKTKVLRIIYPKGSCSSDCHPIEGLLLI